MATIDYLIMNSSLGKFLPFNVRPIAANLYRILHQVLEQTGCEAQLRREASGEVLQLSNRLLVEVKEGETVKIIVPPRRRVALINHAHAATKHMGWKKILASLRKTYTWTAMSAQVKRVVTTCTKCADMRGRRNLAHGQFSSVIYDGPRRAYAFDFYSVAKSKVGYAWVLTVIDLFSREVMFIPTFTRTAEEVVRCLLQHLINVKGVPQVFMTDEAPEFVGKLVEGLCAALKIKHIKIRWDTTRVGTLFAKEYTNSWDSA
jgi:hypothetical protein